MSLLAELRRRKVFKVAAAYIVAAWLALQVADVILNNVAAPPWMFHVLLMTLALGLPVSLVLAWAFQLTSQGVRRESEPNGGELSLRNVGLKILLTVTGVLLLVLCYFVYERMVPDREEGSAAMQADAMTESARGPAPQQAEPARPNSIAVLPFVNSSDDPSNEYFSDGISEELIILLAKIPELRVISRTSAFAFKDRALTLGEVAGELRVQHILEGSVRKDGDRVRIAVRLIDAGEDSELWSDAYDHTLDDIFAIQNRIAKEVVGQLKVPLLGELPTAMETDPQAYALYLQARQVSQRSTAEALTQSSQLYHQALAMAPDYAAAWQGLASNYLNQAAWMLPSAEAYPAALDAGRKAVEAQPDYGPAYAVLGLAHMAWERDLEQAARNLEEALRLDPYNTDTISASATLTMSLGRLAQSLRLAELAVSRDPANARRQLSLAYKYFEAGRFEEAITAARTASKLSPGRSGVHARISAAQMMLGQHEAALESIRREPSEPRRLLGEAMVLHALGRTADSDAVLDGLINEWERELSYNIAYVLAFRGEVDEAFAWLDKAVTYQDGGLYEIVTNSLFAPLHDDPRWPVFLERIGMAPSQLDTIAFDISPH